MPTIDMSSLFHKYPSLLFEILLILLNNLEQNLQSGQLYQWATSNGAEITTSLFAVIHSSHGTFEGLFRPFEGVRARFEALCRTQYVVHAQRS